MASLLRVVPTAMGLIPPSFLLRAQRFAPKKIGRISSGIVPLRVKLTSFVKESKSLFPASDAPIRCFKWTGLRPSGPPEEPAGKESIPDFTDSDEAEMWASSLSGAVGKEIPSGTAGCLSLRLFEVSVL